MKINLITFAVWFFVMTAASFAQFGGGQGDLVLYAVTYNGSGSFQVVPPTTTNSAQSAASFHTTVLSTVPFSTSEPFPLLRQVLYTTNSETIQVGIDLETTIGLHRLLTYDVRLFEIEGMTNPFGTALGLPNTLISFPKGLDVADDIALLTLKVITWFPGPWPFIVATDQQGPFPCPAGTSGFECMFNTPGAIKPAFLLPWTNMSSLYPGSGWSDRVELKMLDAGSLGATIEMIRFRPGASTPMFKIPGHTHLFVLQGSGTIQPAGSAPVTVNKYDYAFLPESFAVTLSNPQQYEGPGAP